MGQKQNVRKTITNDPIEKIWKDNPKIPFMQSKEILAFGYEKGVESITNKYKKRPKTDQQTINNDLTIEQTNKIKLDVYNSVLKYMNNHQDLIQCYSEFKSQQESLMAVLPIEMHRKNYGCNK